MSIMLTGIIVRLERLKRRPHEASMVSWCGLKPAGLRQMSNQSKQSDNTMNYLYGTNSATLSHYGSITLVHMLPTVVTAPRNKPVLLNSLISDPLVLPLKSEKSDLMLSLV